MSEAPETSQPVEGPIIDALKQRIADAINAIPADEILKLIIAALMKKYGM